MPSVTLKNQIQMPLLGFGVLRMKDPEECERCVEAALDAGYRMFDTAASYGNEEAVGRALNRAVKAGKVRRERAVCHHKALDYRCCGSVGKTGIRNFAEKTSDGL